MPEWSIGAVSKTVEVQASVGSNPTLSVAVLRHFFPVVITRCRPCDNGSLRQPFLLTDGGGAGLARPSALGLVFAPRGDRRPDAGLLSGVDPGRDRSRPGSAGDWFCGVSRVEQAAAGLNARTTPA